MMEPNKFKGKKKGKEEVFDDFICDLFTNNLTLSSGV